MGQQQQAQLPEDRVPLLVRLGVWVYPVITGIALYYGIFQMRHLPIASWSTVFLLGNLLLFASWAYFGWWARARTRTLLTSDHPMAESAGIFAARSGLIIKRLYVFPSPRIDAYRTPAGSLCLSSALLRNLNPREAEALIAHNIHLGSAKWGFFFGLTFFFVSGLFSSLVEQWLQHQLGLSIFHANLCTNFGRIGLSLGFWVFCNNWHHRRQKAADAFAVKVTGDPERVVQAILKTHFLSPGMTQGSMENPPDGLKERIRRIRENTPKSER